MYLTTSDHHAHQAGKMSRLKNLTLAFGLPFMLALPNVSWQQYQSTAGVNGIGTDTSSPKQYNHSSKATTIDDQIDRLDDAIKELDEQMSSKGWQKMKQQMDDQLSKIDAEKIQQQMNQAMKQLDEAKIQAEVQKAMSKVDLDKMQAKLEKELAELKNLDHKKFKEELERSLSEAKQSLEEARKVNFEDLKKQLDEAKANLQLEKVNIKDNIDKARAEMNNQKGTIEKSLRDAQIQVKKAREEVVGYKKMIGEMNADGLLDASKDYTINFDKDHLLINGKEQPTSVYKKYQSYFHDQKITITKTSDSFEIGDHQDHEQ